MNTLPRPKPLVVVILDGWGVTSLTEGNAIAAAKTPTMDMFARQYPTACLSAASREVGLPWGEVGNSETGHRNIGAGNVQYQVLMEIDRAIENGSFFKNKTLGALIKHVQDNNSRLHLMGLVSTGGVHSHSNHLFAVLRLLSQIKFTQPVYIHMFTDGRDSPPQSALTYLQQLEETMKHYGVGEIASVTGRFYAMDRNENWDRTGATYQMLTGEKRTNSAPSAGEAIRQSYEAKVFDEMIPPTAITKGGGQLAAVQDNDGVLFFNFRPDRARQLTQAFVQPDFAGFPVKRPQNSVFTTMAEYDPLVPAPHVFRETMAEFPLARIISDAGLTQLHIAETEKYAHITYYLNVGHEEPYTGEKHVLIKSAAVKNFAETPKMGAQEITDTILKEIEAGTYDCYFVNFANPDMVGHTGDFKATVEACSFVDECLGRIFKAVSARKGAMLITADHGNAEEKLNAQTQEVETDHTSNPVPIHYVTEALRRITPKSDAEAAQAFTAPIGVLADVAPTILEILHLKAPSSMTGVSLLNSLQ